MSPTTVLGILVSRQHHRLRRGQRRLDEAVRRQPEIELAPGGGNRARVRALLHPGVVAADHRHLPRFALDRHAAAAGRIRALPRHLFLPAGFGVEVDGLRVARQLDAWPVVSRGIVLPDDPHVTGSRVGDALQRVRADVSGDRLQERLAVLRGKRSVGQRGLHQQETEKRKLSGHTASLVRPV
jgi:hypothetical protein